MNPQDLPPVDAKRTPGRRGCLIALAVGGAVSLGSMALSWKLVERRNEGVLRGAEDLAHIVDASRQLPGAAALRELGCDGAGMLDPTALAALAAPLERAEAQKQKRAPRHVEIGELPVVYCAVRMGKDELDCEKLAATYVAAAKPESPFMLTSRVEAREVCAVKYSAGGEAMGPAVSPNLPLLTPLSR